MRGRYYNPEIRRFTTIDPAEDGLNWNAYCGNNPLDYTDPSSYVRVAMLPKQVSLMGELVNEVTTYYSEENLLELIDIPSVGNSILQYIAGYIPGLGIAFNAYNFMAEVEENQITKVVVEAARKKNGSKSYPFSWCLYWTTQKRL